MKHKNVMGCGRFLSLSVYLCETEPSVRPFLCSNWSWIQAKAGSRKPLWLLPAIIAGFSAGISHSYLCPQRHNAISTDCNWRDSFCWLQSDNDRRLLEWPWHHIGACHDGIALYYVSSLLPFSECHACHLWQFSVCASCVPHTCRLVNRTD